MKTLIKYFSLSTFALASVFFLSSCEKDEDPQLMEKQSIVEIASGDPNFSILVEALVKADLVTALEGSGPFTVFAPTNEAFEMLFTDLGVSGISDLSAEALKPILLFHVVAASAKSSTLSTGYIESLNTTNPGLIGSSLFIETESSVMINGSSKVSTADIEASNGVIHVIDKVLLPVTVVDIAIANPSFSILVEAVVKAGLVDALSSEGPFTVFAPTNEAFEMLFTDLGVSGIADLTAEALIPILLYHVVSGNVNASQVTTGMVPTLNEEADLDIMVSTSGVTINETSNVIAVDVQGSNGVIHAIDKVLLP